MKFARYLEETQTPEWKRAYIDYRGLKKRITAIRREQEGLVPHGENALSSGEDPLLPGAAPHGADNTDSAASPPPIITPGLRDADGDTDADSEGYQQDFEEATAKVDRKDLGEHPSQGSRPLADMAEGPNSVSKAAQEEVGSPMSQSTGASPILGLARGRAETTTSLASCRSDEGAPSESAHADAGPQHPSETSPSPKTRPSHARSSTLLSIASPFLHSSRSFMTRLPTLSRAQPSPAMPPMPTPSFNGVNGNMQPAGFIRPLGEIIQGLTATQKRFFDKLNAELEKVENFYLDREQEAKTRSTALKEQLQELKDHRRLFYEAHPPSSGPWISALTSILPHYEVDKAQAHLKANLRETAKRIPHDGASQGQRSRSTSVVNFLGLRGRGEQNSRSSSRRPADAPNSGTSTTHDALRPRLLRLPESGGKDAKGKGRQREKYDPDEYMHAKKKLKKAVLEYYRGLEMLNDYRILNLTGFRKALKKFEKVSKIQAQTAYIRERVDPSAFASGDTVRFMIKEMEELFAARFARGDKKKAMIRLRGGWRTSKSHHFSSFRSGALVGLAIPALVDGLVKSFQPETRAALPQWDGLLYVYGILFIPTLFACLVGVNLLTWANTRINYVFIFELDVRTRLDHHEYLELPALLLSTLIYCFYFSFTRAGENTIHPTSWPLLWLLFSTAVMINPFPILARSARYWIFRNWGRLLISGTRRVEFADFWMGDQFCSLIFTLSNLYFLGCVYTNAPGGDIGTESTSPDPDSKPRFGFTDWKHCTTSKPGSIVWVVPIVLAMLPLFVRLVQSAKRWVDSRLITHLINGGKYGAGMVYYALYYNWRHHGGRQGGAAFVLWVLMGSLYAVYASTWDYFMDWSVLKPHAKYPLLRPELLYSNHVWVYYFAILSNVLVRFIWVLYIPARGPSFVLRTFIAGMLEMFRRVQWNFIRVENEHLGNVDQYRVTREVPLPYSIEELAHESEGDEDMDEDAVSKSAWRNRRRALSIARKDKNNDQA